MGEPGTTAGMEPGSCSDDVDEDKVVTLRYPGAVENEDDDMHGVVPRDTALGRTEGDLFHVGIAASIDTTPL